MKKKRILIGFTTLLLLLRLATTALGASFYLDIMKDGTTDTGTEFDSEMTVIGATIPVDNFQFDFEYVDGDFAEPEIEFDSYTFKAGCNLVKNKDVKLTGKFGYVKGDLELGGHDLEIDSLLLGLEADFKIGLTP